MCGDGFVSLCLLKARLTDPRVQWGKLRLSEDAASSLGTNQVIHVAAEPYWTRVGENELVTVSVLILPPTPTLHTCTMQHRLEMNGIVASIHWKPGDEQLLLCWGHRAGDIQRVVGTINFPVSWASKLIVLAHHTYSADCPKSSQGNSVLNNLWEHYISY